MRAIPRLDLDAEEAGRRARLDEIPGIVPVLTQAIPGCAFASRCAFATDLCRNEPPPLFEQAGGGVAGAQSHHDGHGRAHHHDGPERRHLAACWHTDRVLEAAA
jgi:peptide/nickel transport system ATP-binding protein